MIKLFDLIKIIFEKPKEWYKITNQDKRGNFFMINRFMAIKYPVEANQFNHIKITPDKSIDVWQSLMSRVYSKVPGWIFTKTKAVAVDKKKVSTYEPSEEVIKFYLERNKASMRDYNDAKKLMKETLYIELEKIEKNLH